MSSTLRTTPNWAFDNKLIVKKRVTKQFSFSLSLSACVKRQTHTHRTNTYALPTETTPPLILIFNSKALNPQYLDALRLIDALLVIADVEVVLHVEELVDVVLLTCHLDRVTVAVCSAAE